MELKRVSRRQVPPELVFLAHDERETAAKGVGAFGGDMAQDTSRSSEKAFG